MQSNYQSVRCSLTELYLSITSLLEVAVLHEVELVYGVLLEIVRGSDGQGVVVAHRVVLNSDIRASNEGLPNRRLNMVVDMRLGHRRKDHNQMTALPTHPPVPCDLCVCVPISGLLTLG